MSSQLTSLAMVLPHSTVAFSRMVPWLCAKLECATIGSIDVRIGPSRVGGVRHRQIGLQGDFSFVTLR